MYLTSLLFCTLHCNPSTTTICIPHSLREHPLKNIQSDLPYLERVHAGFLSKIKYILWTKFPTEKHVFGRAIVMIALITSLSLTGLPTLLSRLYPVEITYVPFNNVEVTLDYQQLRLARVKPNSTSIDDLLDAFGIPVKQSIFSYYPVAMPQATQCQITSDIVKECLGFEGYVLFIPGNPLQCALLSQDPHSQSCAPTTPFNGTDYQYFNNTPLNLPSVYDANSYLMSDLSDPSMSVEEAFDIGTRSVENCLSDSSFINGGQCVTHTLELLVVKDGAYIIEKKLFYQHSQVYSDDDFSNCELMPTTTLQRMCAMINVTQWLSDGRIVGLQSYTNTSNSVQWDIYWINSVNAQGLPFNIGSLSLNISITAYKGATNFRQICEMNPFPSCDSGRELFEATLINTAYYMDDVQYIADWGEWGFLPDDINNLTRFILQGSPIFGGALVVTEGAYLANIPNLTLYVIGGVIILIFIIGLLVDRGVSSTVKKPFSEVIAGAITADEEPSDFWNRSRVANLTLRAQVPSQQSADQKSDRLCLYIDNIKTDRDDCEKRLLSL